MSLIAFTVSLLCQEMRDIFLDGPSLLCHDCQNTMWIRTGFLIHLRCRFLDPEVGLLLAELNQRMPPRYEELNASIAQLVRGPLLCVLHPAGTGCQCFHCPAGKGPLPVCVAPPCHNDIKASIGQVVRGPLAVLVTPPCTKLSQGLHCPASEGSSAWVLQPPGTKV